MSKSNLIILFGILAVVTIAAFVWYVFFRQVIFTTREQLKTLPVQNKALPDQSETSPEADSGAKTDDVVSPVSLKQDQSALSNLTPIKDWRLYEENISGFRFRYPPNFVLRELAKEKDGDPSLKSAYKIEPKIPTSDAPVFNFNIFQVPFGIKVKETEARYQKEAGHGSAWERVIVWNIVGAQQFTIRRDDGSGALYFLIPRRRGEETYSFELSQATKSSLDQALTLIMGIAKTFEFTMPSISEWPRVTAKHLNQNAAFSFQYPPDWLLPTSEGVEGPVGAIHPFYGLYVPGKPDAAVNVEMYVSLETRNTELYSTWENQVGGITVSGYNPKSITYETRIIAGKATLYHTYLAHDVSPAHNVLFLSSDGKFIVRASLLVGKPEEADQFWSTFEDFINSIIIGS